MNIILFYFFLVYFSYSRAIQIDNNKKIKIKGEEAGISYEMYVVAWRIYLLCVYSHEKRRSFSSDDNLPDCNWWETIKDDRNWQLCFISSCCYFFQFLFITEKIEIMKIEDYVNFFFGHLAWSLRRDVPE